MSVQILMATWNGDKYLKEQIESILAQTYRDWILLIHDDGSTDRTLDLLAYYAALDKRIVLVQDTARGLGAAGNFMHLIQQADADYVFFCDQDDIWQKQKMEEQLRVLKSCTGPALVYSNGKIMKAGRLTDDPLIFFKMTALKDILFLNAGVHGCVCAFNRPLLDIAKTYSGPVCMHDHLMTLLAATFGRLEYINKDLIHYRSHEKNVTAGYETGLWKKIKNFIKHKNPVIDKNHAAAVIGFYHYFSEKLPENAKMLFSAFCSYIHPETSRFKRVRLLRKYDFRLGQFRYALFIKTLFNKPV